MAVDLNTFVPLYRGVRKYGTSALLTHVLYLAVYREIPATRSCDVQAFPFDGASFIDRGNGRKYLLM